MTENNLREIWNKTKGHCHFCGDSVEFRKRGWKKGSLEGHWEVDHVIQRAKGGAASYKNCLPACTRCNRLRWHRTGSQIRELIFLGLLVKVEMRKATTLGKQFLKIKAQRLKQNKKRRSVNTM